MKKTVLHGYIRLAKNAPREADQIAALLAAGVDAGQVEIWRERRGRKAKPRPTLDKELPNEGWPVVLRRCRAGDVVVVAHPVVLAPTQTAVLEALAALEAKGVGIYDCTRGRVIAGAVDIQAFTKDAIRGVKRGYTRAFAEGRKFGRKPAVSKIGIDKLCAMWRDPQYSVEYLEEISGLSGRTIRNRCGNRTGEK